MFQLRACANDGQPGARTLFVGEAPGREETIAGKVFVGRTGQYIRKVLRHLNYGPVRLANVCPGKTLVPRNVHGMMAVAAENWHHIDKELSTGPKLIVACGRLALYRLTGKHELLAHHGGMWRAIGLPTHVQTTKGLLATNLPLTAVVVSIQHPAAVMRTKTGAGYEVIEQTLALARRYFGGLAAWQNDFCGLDLDVTWDTPTPAELDKALSTATVVAVDTEFDPSTGVPYLIGLATTASHVMSVPLHQRHHDEYVAVLRRHMQREDLLKTAHYHVADTDALRRVDVATKGPWFDTLEAFSHLRPDVQVGLTHAATFYLPGLHNWKDMERSDPAYNAIDVTTCFRLREIEYAELANAGLLDVFMRERMVAAPVAAYLEALGLQVDEGVRAATSEAFAAEGQRLTVAIKQACDEVFAKRAATAENNRDSALDKRDATKVEGVRACLRHPTYDGLRGKRWTSDVLCTCQAVYNHPVCVGVRAQRKALLAAANKHKAKAKRWGEGGFNPANNEHLRWLLYDKAGFGLPTQRKDGRPTANATAIARLVTLPATHAKGSEVVALLTAIKRVQHLAKMRGTFLFDSETARGRLDLCNVVHPPYRMFGTGTGRPASGSDAATEERRPSPYAFNALNIPDECRLIYVPHTLAALANVAAHNRTNDNLRDVAPEAVEEYVDTIDEENEP